jgi:hypothetical protein
VISLTPNAQRQIAANADAERRITPDGAPSCRSTIWQPANAVAKLRPPRSQRFSPRIRGAKDIPLTVQRLAGGDSVAKTTCPVTRAEFMEKAQPVEVVINGNSQMAEVKEFSTGSLGWYLNNKTNIKVGDKLVTVQIGMNLTIVGSKELPRE